MTHKKKKSTTKMLVIDINKTTCPICNQTGLTENLDGEIICKCGYIYRTPHQYVAGFRINTELDFKKIYRSKKE